MVIKVQGGRIRVDDNEPRVIKIGGVGPQGPVGVVNATAPVTYNSTTKTVGITTGTANGVAPLDANSLVPKANLPSVAINDTFVVNSQAAMLALTAQTGDVAIRTDVNKNFILATDSPSTLADWKELLTPPDAVTSVAGKTGVVTLTDTDITGLGSLATKSTVTSADITDGTIATADLADSSVTSAKIADGTIVNADVSASAAIADSKLNLTTTVSGTAVSSSNRLIDASSSFVDRPDGMIVYPYATGSRVYSANVVRWTRVLARRPLAVKRIMVRCLTPGAGGSNSGADTIEVGIYYDSNQGTTASNWTRVATSGGVNGSSGSSPIYTTNTGTTLTTLATAGNKWIPLTSTYTLVAGHIYYIGIAYTAPTPTANNANTPALGEAAIVSSDPFGGGLPYAESMSQGSQATLPTNMGSAVASGAQPYFVLSTA